MPVQRWSELVRAPESALRKRRTHLPPGRGSSKPLLLGPKPRDQELRQLAACSRPSPWRSKARCPRPPLQPCWRRLGDLLVVVLTQVWRAIGLVAAAVLQGMGRAISKALNDPGPWLLGRGFAGAFLGERPPRVHNGSHSPLVSRLRGPLVLVSFSSQRVGQLMAPALGLAAACCSAGRLAPQAAEAALETKQLRTATLALHWRQTAPGAARKRLEWAGAGLTPRRTWWSITSMSSAGQQRFSPRAHNRAASGSGGASVED